MEPVETPGIAAPIWVAVPVHNEAERIGDCLRALALQQDIAHHRILLVLNNCTDGTADIVRATMPKLPVPVLLHDIQLPPDQAFAGHARRLAMQEAAALAGPDGVVLTTDADSRVAPDWLSCNLRHLNNGADAVMGRAVIDPVEAAAIPAKLHADDALECAYAALLDEIASLADPDPFDPWPRHDEHSGASIAVTVAAYRRAGGMPAVKLAEDRLFHDALRAVDARIRHAPEVSVIVSGRLEGRAQGGMADTMRRRMQQPDEFLDDRLEAAHAALRRAQWRAAARLAWQTHDEAGLLALQRDLQTDTGALRSATHFGAAWQGIVAASPVLVRQRVPVSELAAQTDAASAIRDALRHAAGPAGRPLGAEPVLP